MDRFPWEAAVLAAVLLLNRVVLPWTLSRPAAFWTLQAVDGALVIAVAVLPGLTSFPVVRWLVGGLLVFHVAQNFAVRSQARRRRERAEAEKEHLRMLRELRRDDPG